MIRPLLCCYSCSDIFSTIIVIRNQRNQIYELWYFLIIFINILGFKPHIFVCLFRDIHVFSFVYIYLLTCIISYFFHFLNYFIDYLCRSSNNYIIICIGHRLSGSIKYAISGFTVVLCMIFSKAKLNSKVEHESPYLNPLVVLKLSDSVPPIWTSFIAFLVIFTSLPIFVGMPNYLHCWGCYKGSVQAQGNCARFITWQFFYGEELLVPRPTPKLED